MTPGASTTRATPRPAPPGPSVPHVDPFAVDGRSARWVDHREARRAELVRIARRTVHHRGPDVSMEEIATAAGTSKSIVYRYFSDKTGLQIAVAEAVVLQIQGALEGVLRVAPTPRDGLRAMVAVYLEMIESSPNVYAFVTRDGSVESGGPLGHFLDSVTHLVALPFARVLADGDAHASDEAASDERASDEAVSDEAVSDERASDEAVSDEAVSDEVAPDEVAPDEAARDDQPSAPLAVHDALAADPATAARSALAEAWAAGAVGFVRGAGEWWMAHRDEAGTPDRETLTAQVAAWLWAGPVGLLARERTTRTPWEIR
ncbi:TetR family transcriptional regulator [Cellulomonas sp. DKR-3]|uniref:TetR family transcriptional regulator n=1 Tax=Cellulomonas fulva TaxID=2835530 RepID=A0ABS5TY04_9CELL|nr:TetR family transcriptional regulator [Cellulomonas fulva]